MTLSHPMIGLTAALLLVTLPAHAQRLSGVGHDAETAHLRAGQDPLAPVYVVTSTGSFQRGVRALASKKTVLRNSLGQSLVVATMPTWRLDELSHYMHEKEGRCGGYFAFESHAEAMAFIRNDQGARGTSTTFSDYPITQRGVVNAWMPQVQEASIRGTISTLSSFQNRYFASSHGLNSAVWIHDMWQGLAAGRSDVTTELFTACGNCATQPSVILTIRGAELPDQIVVLGGHLDSIRSGANGDPNMLAPGADDDASGIATLTEVLRIAMANGYRPKRTIKFMGYAAEEVGLRGSRAIAESFRAQGRNVVGVLQLDMTNWKSPNSTAALNLITDFANAPLKQFIRNLFATYMAPRGLTMSESACGYACSDHASWTAMGYPAVMYDEGPIFPSLHTPNDRLDNMGGTASHSVPIAQLGVAFMVELGKSQNPKPTPPIEPNPDPGSPRPGH